MPEQAAGDIDLIRRARQEDVAAFRRLVDLHAETLWRCARALCRDDHEAEDLAQETLTVAWRSLPLDASPGRLLAAFGTRPPEHDATIADRGSPPRFHPSATWKKFMVDFFHGQPATGARPPATRSRTRSLAFPLAAAVAAALVIAWWRTDRPPSSSPESPSGERLTLPLLLAGDLARAGSDVAFDEPLRSHGGAARFEPYDPQSLPRLFMKEFSR